MVHLTHTLLPKQLISIVSGSRFRFIALAFSLTILFQFSSATNASAQCTTANPDFSATCEELKVILVLDESNSINFGGGHEDDVENATLAFVTALKGTGAEIALVEFGTSASEIFGYNVADDSFEADVANYLKCDDLGINCDFGSYSPAEGNWTNWEAALNAVIAIDGTQNADLVVFMTDGNPTAYDVNTICGNTSSCWNLSTNEACPAATTIRNGGTHIFGLGVGSSISAFNLRKISGNNEYDGTNFAEADYQITDNFDDLAEDIKAIAVEICGTDLAISKEIDQCYRVEDGVNVVDFTIEITNLGTPNGLPATNVSVSDDLESGYAFISASSDVGEISLSGSRLTWDNFDLEVDETQVITITVEVLASGNYDNVAFGTADNALSAEDAAVSTPNFDNTPPEILDIPDFDIGECNGDWPENLETTWSDNLAAGGTITSDAGSEVTINPDGCSQSRVYTFTVADDCGNEDTESTIVTRDFDEDAPEIEPIDDFMLEGCNTDWPDVSFNWTDACGVDEEVAGSTLSIAGEITLDDCIESRDYSVTITDDCGNESTASVLVSRFVDDEDPEITCTTEIIDLGCTDIRPTIEDALAEISSFDNCGIQSEIATPGIIIGECVLTQVFNVVVTDDCEKTSNCDVTFTWIEADDIILSCPQVADVNLDACSTQGEIEAAYATWVAGFSVTGGCNTTSNINDIPALPDFACGGPISLTFTFSATGECGEDSCEASFSVADAEELVVNCPADITLDACSTESEIAAAYASWAAGFTVDDGCNTDSNIDELPALPDFDCGNAVNLTFTLSASDDCGEDECTATFTVIAEDDLVIACPESVNLPACSTQAEIEAAYSTWAAGFTVAGGCNTTSNIDDIPALPAFDCGNALNLTFTLSASDDCGDDTCTATFNVAAEDDLVIDCPDPVVLGSSLPEAEIVQAYNDWVAGFTVEGGCNTTSNIDEIPGLPSYDCGLEIDISFTFTAIDDCGEESCVSTFFVPGTTGLTVTCPADPQLPSCASQLEIETAYQAWVDGFSVNDGDNPISNILDIPALPAFDCGNAVNLSFTLSAGDDCTPDASCSATFTVLAEDDLVIACPESVNLPACSTQAEIEAAYSTWAAGFTVAGGCNTNSNLAELPALPPFDCGNALSLSFTLSASDDCGADACTATFIIQAEDDLVITCPAPVELGSSLPESEILQAYNNWVAGFTVEGGCTTTSNISEIPSLPAYGCGLEIDLTFTLSASDDCGEEMCESSFFVPGVIGLTVTCPVDPALASCSTQEEIETAYAAWVAGFNVNNGDTPVSNIAEIPALPDFDCGNTVNLSFTLSASDACTPDASCSATFTVLAEDDLVIDCPEDINLPACSTESEIAAAYSTWAAGFTVEGGCSTISNIDKIPALPDFDCGNVLSLSFTLSASDDCGVDACTATFNVAAEEDLVITCPEPVTLASSLPEEEILQAYNDWVAAFSVVGGCNTISNIADIPALPPYDCGSGVDLSFTLSASDDCGDDTCESTFFVPGTVGLTVSCPENTELPSCATQVEIETAYAAWVTAFSVNNGDNPSSNIADIPALPNFECGNAINLSFTLSASDDCTTDASCSATFVVLAEDDLVIACPQDVNLPACSTESEIAAAYVIWAAGFTVDGGCNTSSNIDEIPTLPAFDCGNAIDLSFTLSASDDCGADDCTAVFNVAGEDDLVINCPAPLELGSSLTEAEILQAYNVWASGFTVEGGCNTISNLTDIPSLPPYDCGAEINLVFALSATDDCGEDGCESTFFVPGVEGLTVSCPVDPQLNSCATQAEIEAAYALWVAGFSVNEGDAPSSNIADIPALPDFDCGNAVNLSFTLSASDDCTADASCSATFTVLAEADLVIDCPESVNLPACSTENEIAAAYEIWAAGFTVDGGCSTISNLADLPLLPEYNCENAINLIFALAASDDCGSASCEASFTVGAKETVAISCPESIDASACDYAGPVELNAAYQAWLNSFTVTEGGCDAASGFNEEPPASIDYCLGAEITLTFAADDGCTSAECTATFTVLGNLDPPLILTAASSEDLGCNPTIIPPTFSINDNCDPNAVVEIEDSGVQGTACGMMRTWTATYSNQCYTAVPSVITYTWTEDTDAPTILTTSVSGSLGCNPAVTAPIFTTDDECAPNASVDVEDGGVVGDGCEKSQTWTATYSNECYTSDPVSITFTWTEDTEIPVIETENEDQDLGCNPAMTTPVFIVNDNCDDATGVVTAETDGPISDGCSYEQTWIANYTDACGNEAEELSVTYTWTVDNEAPEIEFTNQALSKIGNGGTLRIQCYGQDPNWSLPEASVNDVSVTDDCEGEVQVVATEVVLADGECETDGYIQRLRCTWTATDACGNESSVFIYMEIIDEIPPVISGVPADVTVSCDNIPSEANVTATDECLCADVEMEESVITAVCLDGQVIERVYTATDCCGNTTTATQRITLSDETSPELQVLLPDGTIITENHTLEFDCNSGGIPPEYENLTAEAATAADACSGTPNLRLDRDTDLFSNCSGGLMEKHIFIWVASDACQNSSSVKLTINIIDTVPPEIVNFEGRICDDSEGNPFVFATDNCSGAFIQHFDQEIDGGCGTEFLRIYEASDACGNISRVEQYIIKDDVTPPEIELSNPDFEGLSNGDSLIIEWNSQLDGSFTQYVVEDANFIDECGFDLETAFEESLVVDLDCQSDNAKSIVALTWRAVDFCGNEANFIIYGIIVDTQAPTLIDFEPEIIVDCADAVPEVKAEDNSGSVEIIYEDEIIPGNCPNNYVIQRSVTVIDQCSNKVEAIQIINIIDETGPVIIGVPEYACDDLSIPDAVAIDACGSGSLPVSMVQDTVFNEACENELIIQRIWTATDLCGNTTELVQLIAFNDVTPPELIYNEEIRPYLDQTTKVFMSDLEGMEYVESINWYNIVALDLCIDMQIIPDFNITSELSDDCAVDGYYEKKTFSWVFTDICGNVSSEEFEILIIDDVAPLLVDVPESAFFGCAPIPELGTIDPPVFSGLMDSMTSVITFDAVEEMHDNIMTVSNIWTATDMCGNTVEAVQELSALAVSELAVVITGGEDILCNSHNNTLTANITDGLAPFTYEWTIDGEDCQIQSGQNTPMLDIYVAFSEVLVTVNITDANGCEASSELLIECISKGQSGDRSIQLADPNQLSISSLVPNPASERITINVESNVEQGASYRLLNIMNQSIINRKIILNEGVNNIDLDVRDYAPGIYYILIENGESSDIKRFMKIK